MPIVWRRYLFLTSTELDRDSYAMNLWMLLVICELLGESIIYLEFGGSSLHGTSACEAVSMAFSFFEELSPWFDFSFDFLYFGAPWFSHFYKWRFRLWLKYRLYDFLLGLWKQRLASWPSLPECVHSRVLFVLCFLCITRAACPDFFLIDASAITSSERALK